MSAIRLDSATVVANDGTRLLDAVTLDVLQGELVVVIGPSGSGKTTVIRAVAGFEQLRSGAVFFDDSDYTAVPVAERDVGVVFQTSALFPTATARGNVSFPLRIRSMLKETIRKRVDAEARALNITKIMERWPGELSAGHQQLVQIARAMVRVPSVLLLDEPMAHLDPPTRRRLRTYLRELQRGYGLTTILATNDPEEAMVMADRIVAIHRGQVQQIGRPSELYAAPATTYVAWLTGPISFLDAVVRAESEGFWLEGEGFRLRAWAPELADHVEADVRLGLRPEALRLHPSSEIRVVVRGKSFESGTEVTRATLEGVQITMPSIDEPPGVELGVLIDSYFVFGTDGRLITAVG